MSNLFDKAKHLDAIDPLKQLQDQFVLPDDQVYLCSHSLGLPAKKSFYDMQNQMKKWADQGARGWFSGDDAWYHILNRDINLNLNAILGAHDNEVVLMNSLTINLHLLLTSFYRPTKGRFKIVLCEPIFPSDLYAIKSHLKLHGIKSDIGLIIVRPSQNEVSLRLENIAEILKNMGGQIALVYLSAANYLTGQIFNLRSLTQLAHQQGCIVGVDMAHAIGNIPLDLHDDEVDFAVGCSYKYLCGGPGSPGVAFVHASHHEKELFRLSGWWGNDPATRFQMNKLSEFVPFGGAASWQVSTPPILGLQPLFASLKIFAETGMASLRKKSLQQTDFLLELLTKIKEEYEIITPFNAIERGNQISIRLSRSADEFSQLLKRRGFVCDVRPPHILRVSISPLYNSFQDLYHFVFDGITSIKEVAA